MKNDLWQNVYASRTRGIIIIIKHSTRNPLKFIVFKTQSCLRHVSCEGFRHRRKNSPSAVHYVSAEISVFKWRRWLAFHYTIMFVPRSDSCKSLHKWTLRKKNCAFNFFFSTGHIVIGQFLFSRMRGMKFPWRQVEWVMASCRFVALKSDVIYRFANARTRSFLCVTVWPFENCDSLKKEKKPNTGQLRNIIFNELRHKRHCCLHIVKGLLVERRGSNITFRLCADLFGQAIIG